MLDTYKLTPAFESYITEDGLLNNTSLGRAIHGLGRHEIRDYTETVNGFDDTAIYSTDDTFQSISSASYTGTEINIHVSLPLPLSDEIASSRFANLPSNLAGRHG